VVLLFSCTLLIMFVFYISFPFILSGSFSLLFFSTNSATTDIYTLSLHDALPIWEAAVEVERGHVGKVDSGDIQRVPYGERCRGRSEEHTSELQSRFDLVCRLLLEKKKEI